MATSWHREAGEDWGPWTLHNGKSCPLPTGTMVEVVSEDRFGSAHRAVGMVTGGAYSSWFWENFPKLRRILRYRERKPKGLRMLEDRLVGIEAPSRRDRVDAG